VRQQPQPRSPFLKLKKPSFNRQEQGFICTGDGDSISHN
jgi:hypothetical protein